MIPTPSQLQGVDDVWQMPSTDSDVILLTHVHLARNAETFRFPNTENHEILGEIADMARQAIYDNGFFADYWPHGFECPLSECSYTQRRFLEEGFQLPYQLATRAEPHQLLLSNGNGCESIVVNGRDHFVFSTVLPGWQPFITLGRTMKTEQEFVTRIMPNFAFDEQLGYLTTRPEDAGTGLRIGVIVHLPGLMAARGVNRMKSLAKEHDIVMKEYRWQGVGVYLLVNNVAIGQNEEEIVMNLRLFVEALLDNERAARDELWSSHNLFMADQVCRSLAMLEHTRLLDWQECANHLLMMRLAVQNKVVRNLKHSMLNYLLLRALPCHMALAVGMEFPQKGELNDAKQDVIIEIDSCRAQLMRQLRKVWQVDLPSSWG